MGGLLKNNSLQGILRYNGGTKGYTNSNELKHGVWYNQNNDGSMVNMPFNNGFSIVYELFTDNVLQIHFSGAADLCVRTCWGGVWYEAKYTRS